MAQHGLGGGPFDIPEMTNRIPRRLKPWVYILFVIIIQFSGGLYLAATSELVGTKALMPQDIQMAGFAQLVGMSVNFAVMFRLKFRFTAKNAFIVCNSALIGAAVVCVYSESVPVLVAACYVAGWFRMWATFICNSAIQLWITPKRDMSVFFCYVYIIVDGVMQLTGLSAVYVGFYSEWKYMHWVIIAALALMLFVVLFILKLKRCPMFIPLLGIDWIGMVLWSVAMLSFTFICVYGNHYDWWESEQIVGATLICAAGVALNLWRATFLRHPFISFQTLTNYNVARAMFVYAMFFMLMAPEHVMEHTYAGAILGFDETNLIDLNWYVLSGVLVGIVLTYIVFARYKTSYKNMICMGVSFGVAYLACFYFLIDYNVEKEMLFIPLFLRGLATVIISIVLLTSMVQSGLPFMVFPQALAINGFMGAVFSGTFGPAVVGEWFSRTVAANASLIGSAMTASNIDAAGYRLGDLFGVVNRQAMIVSMKEIYGWLLIGGLVYLLCIACSYSPVRPAAIFPKWRTIRKLFKRSVAEDLAVAED